MQAQNSQVSAVLTQNMPNIPDAPFFFLACQPFSVEPNISTMATATLSAVCRLSARRAMWSATCCAVLPCLNCWRARDTA